MLGSFKVTGDVTGDGINDIVALAVLSGGPAGFFVIGLDGNTGSVLYQLNVNNNPTSNSFAHIIALGDTNGNSVPDFAIVSSDSVAVSNGPITIYDGANGNLIRIINAPTGSTRFGFAMDSIADLDGDNVLDLIVSDAVGIASTNPGIVYIYSSANGNLLYTINDPSSTSP